MNTYQPGATLRGSDSQTIFTIDKHLNTGGQGEVYRVIGPEQQRYAAKLLHRDCINAETIRHVETLIKQGKPSDHFAWFHESLSGESCDARGFLMEYVGEEYVRPIELLAGRFNPDFLTLTRYGMHISLAVSHIHALGKVYGDISHHNLFLHPSGTVRLIDNDNIVTNNTASAILGTPPYMPPELFPFNTPHLLSPNIHTDRYSLAVLLYHLFVREHPLHGTRHMRERRIPERRKDLLWYGKNGTFVFDPSPANTNPPDPNIHRHAIANWAVLPEALKKLFVRAFVDGRLDPTSRPRVSEWIALFADLPNRLFKCSHDGCGADNFYNDLRSQTCWRCRKATRPAAMLHFSNGSRVCLASDTRLFDHHIQPNSHRYRFDEPVAVIERSPNSNQQGFRNLSGRIWYAIPKDKPAVKVTPNRVIALRNHLRLNFGTTEAEIRRVV